MLSLQLLQSLPAMSLAISIVVVICMAISFAVLFFLYGSTKSKGVDFGVEDDSIKTELLNRLNKRESGTTYMQMLADGRKKEKIIQLVTDIILLVLIVLAGALTVFAFVLRSKGEQVYFGDTAYLTVLTSSMQEKNGNNPYLKENDDGVRIHQYALIGIDKVDPSELKEGDVIAFIYEGNTIYVHRIVFVRDVDGEWFFTTMGDANDISSPNETNIAADRIVGVFNGYHNGYLGVFLIYIRSDIGMITLIFVFLLLAVISSVEWLITRSYEKRQTVLAAEMDSEEAAMTCSSKTGLSPAEETEEPEEEIDGDDDVVAEDFILPLDGETSEAEPVMRVIYDRSFTAKLTLASDEIKGLYGKLKNKILSYGKVRSAISWKHDCFLFSTKGTAAKITVRGKTLYVWLPFDEATYSEVGVNVNTKNNRCFVRVKGNVTLNRAFKAIDVAMKKMGAAVEEDKNEDYYLLYRTEEELLNDGLIKKKTVSADRIGIMKKHAGDCND